MGNWIEIIKERAPSEPKPQPKVENMIAILPDTGPNFNNFHGGMTMMMTQDGRLAIPTPKKNKTINNIKRERPFSGLSRAISTASP